MLATDPTADLAALRRTSPPPLVLSKAAVVRLLTSAEEAGRQAWAVRPCPRAARLGAGGAVRHGVLNAEARAARVVELDREGASLLVRSTKRGAWRRVSVSPRTLAALAGYLSDARPVLLGCSAAGPIPDTSCSPIAAAPLHELVRGERP